MESRSVLPIAFRCNFFSGYAFRSSDCGIVCDVYALTRPICICLL